MDEHPTFEVHQQLMPHHIPPFQYRSEIDGLRALAIVPVVFFHADFELFSGGYVGVDVFFVISGYLITSIILTEIRAGDFQLANFYERRARRILPALIVVSITCIPFAWFWMLPDSMENFGQSLVATMLFGSNVLFYLTSGYWDLASEFKPLLHTWSLSIEEQYYLLFPVFLTFTWKYGARFTIVVIVFIFLASLLFAFWAIGYSPKSAFYLLPSRSWELLYGAICAWWLHHKTIPVTLPFRQHLSLVGFALIASAVLFFDSATPTPGLYTLIPTTGTVLLILFATPGTLAQRVLSVPPIVSIGLISYSLYLWHYPVLAFSRVYSHSQPPLTIRLFLIVLSFGLAFLTWQLIEKRYRSSQTMSRRCLYVTLIVGICGLSAFGYAAHLTHGFPHRASDSESILTEDMNITYNQSVHRFQNTGFSDSDKTKVLVLGNSFARDVVNSILETYVQSGIELIYQNSFNFCRFANDDNDLRALWDADLILVAYNNTPEQECTQAAIKLSNSRGKILLFIGTKQFGYNLNWIARLPVSNRVLLKNIPAIEALLSEAYAKSYIPEENYISIMDAISDKTGVYITDENGQLLSADKEHLTRAGAIFLGKLVFYPSILSDYLVPVEQ